MRVRYYRQSNKKMVLLGFMELIDVLFLTPVVAIAVALKSPDAAVVGMMVYILYGLFFRAGRAPGFGYHFFRKRLWERSRLRPGKILPPYPYNTNKVNENVQE